MVSTAIINIYAVVNKFQTSEIVNEFSLRR